jgi:5-methyltetrahydropteroyltriglutamate--homocysteine methyltransferase
MIARGRPTANVLEAIASRCQATPEETPMQEQTATATAVGRRTKPPFRADHVGSLLRPERLLQARADHEAGRIDDAELRGIEDEAIREIVAKQEGVGLQSATDGEFRRASWHMDFIYQLDGITKEAGHLAVKFYNENGEIEFTPAALHVDGRLGVSKTIFGDDFRFLQKTVDRNLPKLTIPSPSMVHYRGGKAAIDETVYPDLDAFWADLVDAYREQVRRLGELGCTYLQFDDTSLAYMNDPHQREYVASIGGDAERQHLEYIRHINEALAERPDGMSITTHACRGNFQSSWAAEGSWDFVAEALLNELEVDGFFMEWDDERSGGFEPLRFLPKGEKQVVLGLVTTKRGELESRDELLRRIEEASRYAPLEQLCLSPQCGFSSTVEGNALSEDQQWAKLRLIVEVAEEVWA